LLRFFTGGASFHLESAGKPERSKRFATKAGGCGCLAWHFPCKDEGNGGALPKRRYALRGRLSHWRKAMKLVTLRRAAMHTPRSTTISASRQDHSSSERIPVAPATRITSIDALRGLVMFMMIFVNDLSGAGKVVPDWMVHFSDRHRGGSGMTFVDLVFPAFLFIVGMSIPFALGGRTAQGQPIWRIAGHVAIRTLALLSIGVLMVHETPGTFVLGWSGVWWCVLMYLSAMAAFCSISPKTPTGGSRSRWNTSRIACLSVRIGGLAALLWLAFAFRGTNDQRIIGLAPFRIETSWYGILGLIGWAYLVTAVVFLIFRGNRTAILGCLVLLLCLFGADRQGLFEGFWLNKIVGIGQTLGSLPSIAVCGLLLGSVLTSASLSGLKERTRFTFWLVAGCAAGALLLDRTYGISKNRATPSWCLWACAVTAVLWYVLFLICDVRPVKIISRPLCLAGQNVLLAYLISEMLPGLLEVLHLDNGYGHLAANLPSAIARSALCAVLILFVSTSLNRLGFRLKL
jgi:heparan-alpha-glucosaminide N-acetyltransferase